MAEHWKRKLDRLHAELVRRDDPAAWVTEADAVDASSRYPHLALRGPVFGLAIQDPDAGEHWRLVRPVTSGTPQEARDELNLVQGQGLHRRPRHPPRAAGGGRPAREAAARRGERARRALPGGARG